MRPRRADQFAVALQVLRRGGSAEQARIVQSTSRCAGKEEVFSGETAAPSATRPGPPHTCPHAAEPGTAQLTRDKTQWVPPSLASPTVT